MTKENENTPEAETANDAETPTASADDTQTPLDDLDAPNAEAEAESEAAAPEEPSPEEQVATMKDQLLRTLAELENTPRRAERDRGEALKYGAMNFARDMLSVADNMQRALSAAANMGDHDLPDAVKAMLEGVEATERDLQASLQRHKVMPINPMGEKFDPNLHEAMFEAPGTGQPVGSVIEVIETGYMISDRLLRPAKVGIAKD